MVPLNSCLSSGHGVNLWLNPLAGGPFGSPLQGARPPAGSPEGTRLLAANPDFLSLDFFTSGEIIQMLEISGLEVVDLFESIDQEPYQLGFPRLLLVTEKA